LIRFDNASKGRPDRRGDILESSKLKNSVVHVYSPKAADNKNRKDRYIQRDAS